MRVSITTVKVHQINNFSLDSKDFAYNRNYKKHCMTSTLAIIPLALLVSHYRTHRKLNNSIAPEIIEVHHYGKLAIKDKVQIEVDRFHDLPSLLK